MSAEFANIPEGCLAIAQRLSVGFATQRARRAGARTFQSAAAPDLQASALGVREARRSLHVAADRKVRPPGGAVSGCLHPHFMASKGLASRTHPTLLLALHA